MPEDNLRLLTSPEKPWIALLNQKNNLSKGTTHSKYFIFTRPNYIFEKNLKRERETAGDTFVHFLKQLGEAAKKVLL